MIADRERQAIVQAAQRSAIDSARTQGLPATVTDQDALRRVAALIQQPSRKAA